MRAAVEGGILQPGTLDARLEHAQEQQPNPPGRVPGSPAGETPAAAGLADQGESAARALPRQDCDACLDPFQMGIPSIHKPGDSPATLVAQDRLKRLKEVCSKGIGNTARVTAPPSDRLHFPMQNWLKIRSSKSSVVVLPTISPMALTLIRNSVAVNSSGWPDRSVSAERRAEARARLSAS
jgi:hypothetical protein